MAPAVTQQPPVTNSTGYFRCRHDKNTSCETKTMTTYFLTTPTGFPYLWWRFLLNLLVALLLTTAPAFAAPTVAAPGLDVSAPAASTPLEPTTLVPPSGFVGPVTKTTSPGQVLKGFAKPAKNWLPGHRGVDLKATLGDPIFAAGSGTVLYVGTIAGTPVVSIEHDAGLRTTYQPVFATVTQGDAVAAGDLIGTLAPTKPSEPGLHWGAKYGADDYINPLSLLPKPVIRLKPL